MNGRETNPRGTLLDKRQSIRAFGIRASRAFEDVYRATARIVFCQPHTLEGALRSINFVGMI